jgi:hypothetical protein
LLCGAVRFVDSALCTLSTICDDTTNAPSCTPVDHTRYTAILLFESPSASITRNQPQSPPVDPSQASSFPAVLEEFVAAGGGVFLFPSDDNWVAQMLADVAPLFGLRFPVETITESNLSNVGSMTNFHASLAFTDAVVATDHPVANGVRQLWYPTDLHYNAGETAPLCLTSHGPSCDGADSSNWTVVVRAMPTASTVAVMYNSSGSFHPFPPEYFQRSTPVHAPPLFAVRDYGKGRVAVMAQWRQYTIGSGDAYLFNSQASALKPYALTHAHTHTHTHTHTRTGSDTHLLRSSLTL